MKNDNDRLDIGERLKNLRISCNLKQKEVAERINVHTNTIGAYENNSRKPSYNILRKLAYLYHTSTDYILNCDERQNIFIDDLPKDKQKLILSLVETIRNEYEETKK